MWDFSTGWGTVTTVVEGGQLRFPTLYFSIMYSPQKMFIKIVQCVISKAFFSILSNVSAVLHCAKKGFKKIFQPRNYKGRENLNVIHCLLIILLLPTENQIIQCLRLNSLFCEKGKTQQQPRRRWPLRMLNTTEKANKYVTTVTRSIL